VETLNPETFESGEFRRGNDFLSYPDILLSFPLERTWRITSSRGRVVATLMTTVEALLATTPVSDQLYSRYDGPPLRNPI